MTTVTLENDLNVAVTDGATLSVGWEGATIIYLDAAEFEENCHSHAVSPFETFHADENDVKKTCSDGLSNCNATKESHHVTIRCQVCEGFCYMRKESRP